MGWQEAPCCSSHGNGWHEGFEASLAVLWHKQVLLGCVQGWRGTRKRLIMIFFKCSMPGCVWICECWVGITHLTPGGTGGCLSVMWVTSWWVMDATVLRDLWSSQRLPLVGEDPSFSACIALHWISHHNELKYCIFTAVSTGRAVPWRPFSTQGMADGASHWAGGFQHCTEMLRGNTGRKLTLRKGWCSHSFRFKMALIQFLATRGQWIKLSWINGAWILNEMLC